MSEDDLQLTPEELAKLQSLQAEVSADTARRAKLKRILEAKRKLDAKKKAEAEARKPRPPAMSDEDANAQLAVLERPRFAAAAGAAPQHGADAQRQLARAEGLGHSCPQYIAYPPVSSWYAVVTSASLRSRVRLRSVLAF